MNAPERTIVQALLDAIKAESFVTGTASNDQAMGLLVAKFFHWDALDILNTAIRALEDANFHVQAAQVAQIAAEVVKGDEDELIDGPTRSALFAALGEVYPGIGKDRQLRLFKLNVLAGRPANDPIVSLSDRRGNMTNGDARRVFLMLDELRGARV